MPSDAISDQFGGIFCNLQPGDQMFKHIHQGLDSQVEIAIRSKS
jgi:hypothetical protein